MAFFIDCHIFPNQNDFWIDWHPQNSLKLTSEIWLQLSTNYRFWLRFSFEVLTNCFYGCKLLWLCHKIQNPLEIDWRSWLLWSWLLKVDCNFQPIIDSDFVFLCECLQVVYKLLLLCHIICQTWGNLHATSFRQSKKLKWSKRKCSTLVESFS